MQHVRPSTDECLESGLCFLRTFRKWSRCWFFLAICFIYVCLFLNQSIGRNFTRESRLQLQTVRIRGQYATAQPELTVFQASLTSSGVDFHLSTVLLMKSFTPSRVSGVGGDGRACRSAVQPLTTDCIEDQKHEGNKLVGGASCSFAWSRKVDQWQNLSPCTGSPPTTCWSLASQGRVGRVEGGG